ncbi:TPA: hypothetical protein R4057_002071 [Kluyvera ascorbata]|uniref:hypothetical protein n=1 Tax=Kluyvera ascorbata TaxID=51288 RepID=UPI002896BF4C|nr:hypothetical protein [Kluyvera ascorbata]MEB6387382.1 hypothetical protein [Kluyvera ascorbata]HED3065117.1 hypothetical protein [Kluyvera ascorbata]
MYYDEFQRELEALDFINNKIKRCRACGRELHYKEKFNNTDNICNACKGLPSYDSFDDSEGPIEAIPLQALRKNESQEVIMHGNNHVKKRTFTEEELLKRYPSWQLSNEKAEREWVENNPKSVRGDRGGSQLSSSVKISDERLGEMIDNYDLGKGLDFSQDELISIIWEIMYHRGIINTY